DTFLLPGFTKTYFTTPAAFEPSSAVGYFQLVSYIFGHKDFQHLSANFLLILLVGPIVEERYGSAKLLLMVLTTALVTAIATLGIFHYNILGASGIVFLLVILSSITGKTQNSKKLVIPLTFVLVFSMYFGSELIASFQKDTISHFGHLAGGAFGALFGFIIRPKVPGK
ncbi:MAG: rhomboid family intramembrane serine protease, partial [Candidatus Sungbacteria bacterium]|nr:rhomboid family intramembrane serine protease [Candidatus Sungbacteria bacterium]